MHPAPIPANAPLSGPITTPGTPAVPADQEMPDLDAKEWAFVEAKIAGHSNPKAAQIAKITAASYDARRMKAAYLLRQDRIQRAIAIREQELLADLRVSSAHVKAELAACAFSDITHYEIDDDGRVKRARGAPEHAMRAVSSVKRRVRFIPRGEGEEPIKQVETEFRLWDKNTALKTLGSALEMFKDGGPGGAGLVLVFDMGGATTGRIAELTGGRPHDGGP